jgi:NitT/TauT family transport system substrate-binding protein
VRALSRSLAALVVLCATLTSAAAQEDVKIGIGYGLAFLPLYICEDLKLVEKHAKAAHLDVKASFHRLMGPEEIRDAVASGAIDMGPFGTVPLLAAWQAGKGKPSQILAVSGITSLPLVLLGNRPNERSVADLDPADRIAVPTLTSPQMYLLELQSEKVFGQYDRLRRQVVAMSHADAIAGLVAGSGGLAAYFSSPPFTQIALRDAKVHPLLTSSQVMDGKFSFLIMGATKSYIDARPLVPEVIDKAIDEAAHLIHDDPRRAAQIYLTHEPSGTINGAAMEAVVSDIRDEFGSTVFGVKRIADFMGRHGELATVPASWKEIVAPALLNSPST